MRHLIALKITNLKASTRNNLFDCDHKGDSFFRLFETVGSRPKLSTGSVDSFSSTLFRSTGLLDFELHASWHLLHHPSYKNQKHADFYSNSSDEAENFSVKCDDGFTR